MCQVGANYTTAILTSYDWRDESVNFYDDTAERLSRRLTEFSKKVLLPRSSQVITIQICLPWKQLGVCYSDYLAAVRLCHAKKQRTLSESVYTRLAYSLRKTLWFLLGFDVAGCKKVRGKFRYFHRSVFFAFVSFWTVHCVGVCKIYAVRKILGSSLTMGPSRRLFQNMRAQICGNASCNSGLTRGVGIFFWKFLSAKRYRAGVMEIEIDEDIVTCFIISFVHRLSAVSQQTRLRILFLRVAS